MDSALRNILVVFCAFIAATRILQQNPDVGTDNTAVRQKYDYVIVGAGSAGGVLADRLTQDGQHSVLLLEAGQDDQSEIGNQAHVPINYFPNMLSDADWKYYTEPQENACLAMAGQRSYWPRGKMLGGSTSINGMMWVRGSRHDFDEWTRRGARGWSFPEVLPYFLRAEQSHAADEDPGYHGDSGAIRYTDAAETPELTDALLQGAREIGETPRDVNGKEQIGWSRSQKTVYKGERQSTARTYIKRARDRANLDILTRAHVQRVIFEGKKAVGVEYIHNGEKKSVRAQREVILSAGAIGSPQILMLSGVGHKNHLEDLGIPVVADLPVGDGLLDHLFVDVAFVLDREIAFTPADVDSWTSRLQYSLFGTGPKSTCGVQGIGFQRSAAQPPDDPRPYLEFIEFSTLLGVQTDHDAFLGSADRFGMDRQVFSEFYDGQQGRHGFLIVSKLLHPRSEGTLRLRSRDAFDHPLIDPRYLQREEDVDVILEGIRKIEKLSETKAFGRIGARLWEKHHPGCKEHRLGSDEYWRCYIRHNTLTNYHPVSTCRMGEGPGTVVDSELRVHGLEGLRVIDASVMPDITSGNTNAPTVMLAEKAADIVRGKPPLKPIHNL